MDVSVVVPARDAASVLPACLRAVKEQREVPGRVEVIVVDDGSSDETACVAASFGARVIRQEGAGPAAARNRGAREAAGEILLFTDADCVPGPRWVSEMTAPFADPTVTGVKGTYRTEQTQWVARLCQVEFEERYARLAKRERIDMVDTHAAAFRRSVFLEHGGFDESFGAASNEDTELSYRLAEAGELLLFQSKAWVAHRHPEGLLSYGRKKFGRGYWRIKAYFAHPQRAMNDSYTPQGLKLQIALLPVGGAAAFAGGLWRPAVGAGVLLATGALFLVASVPFLRRARAASWRLLPVAPLFLLVRALALGFGTAIGWIQWGMRAKRCRD